MIFESGFGLIIYETLIKYYKELCQIIARFDYFLEMMVQNAGFLQDLYPGEILDYNNHCKTDVLPDNCKIVCFPRAPKPHQCSHQWLLQFWNEDPL